MKILIAEDDEASRLMLQLLTESWGYETVLAKDGNEAWDIINSDESPPILLLDWEMPGFSGIELCKKIRMQDASNQPYIILLTARDNVSDITLGLDNGANDYIAKPFKEAVLSSRIRVGDRVVTAQHKMFELNQELSQANDNLQYVNQLLAYISEIDPLTKLANRRSLYNFFERELKQCKRERLVISAILVDIDYFKKYNDHYGHIQGDECLMQVAQALSNSIYRPMDFIARYGGEEFLYVLPNTDTAGATKLAKRAMEKVKALNIEHTESECSNIITISLGIATQMPDEISNSPTLTELADQALYQAKAKGRNQYAVYDSALIQT